MEKGVLPFVEPSKLIQPAGDGRQGRQGFKKKKKKVSSMICVSLSCPNPVQNSVENVSWRTQCGSPPPRVLGQQTVLQGEALLELKYNSR